jgi:hypothetical protein
MSKLLRNIIIAGVVLVLLLVGVLVWVYAQTKRQSGPIVQVKQNIPTQNGENVPVNSFPTNTPRYENLAVPYISSDFTIQYTETNHRFDIVIPAASQQEFAAIRPSAEAKLLELLGISETQACQLIVYVTVPHGELYGFSGSVFPLSFCK